MKQYLKLNLMLWLTFLSGYGYAQQDLAGHSVYVDAAFQKQAYEEAESWVATLDTFDTTNTNDSLQFARIYSAAGNAMYAREAYENSIENFNLGINYCPQSTEEGYNLGAKLLFDRAFAEYELNLIERSLKTTTAAFELINNAENPNMELKVDIYQDLAYGNRVLGFYDRAEFYLDETSSLIDQHFPDDLERQIGNRYARLLLSTKRTDAKAVETALAELEAFTQSHQTGKYGQVRLASATSLTGDFYLNNLKTSKDSLRDIAFAKAHLSKAIALSKNEFKSTEVQAKFNLAKANYYLKEYHSAIELYQILLEQTKLSDKRRPFFHAGLVFSYSGLDQKQEMVMSFRSVMSAIHEGDEQLEPDFSNMVYSKHPYHADLIMKIAQESKKVFPNDVEVNALANNATTAAIKQFKSSYRDTEYSDLLVTYYNAILKALLSDLNDDNDLEKISNVLIDIEDIENRLIWSGFVINSQSSSIKFKDSLLRVNRKMLSEADSLKKKGQELEAKRILDLVRLQRKKLPEQEKLLLETINESLDLDSIAQNHTTSFLRYKIVDQDIYVFYFYRGKLGFEKLKGLNFNQLEKHIQATSRPNGSLLNLLDSKLLMPSIFENKVPEQIIIIPDGILHHLAFESLLHKDSFLVNFTVIGYLPSFKYAQLDPTKSLELDDLGIFAPKYSGNATSKRGKALGRLNGAIDEQVWLGNVFSNSDLISVSNSEDFLNKIRGYEILHLAMHTVADASLPDEAVMYISDDDEIDLETLYNTSLSSKLVFLSSCQSARVDDGDYNVSPRSIHRAFAHSGVTNTIASLYEVPDDVTSKITLEFYTQLKAGNSSLFSLSLAKRKYLKEVKIKALSHPYYWSGLVHNGLGVNGKLNSQKVEFLNTQEICILTISIFLMLFFIYWTKSKSQ